MSEWGGMIRRGLQALHLGGIRGRIVALTLIAALVPTLAITVRLYPESRRALTEKVDLELRGVSAAAALELDRWLDERLDDLRLSAGSSVMLGNMAASQEPGRGPALGRLRDYLSLIRDRFPGYETMLVTSPSGRPVASAGGRTGNMALSAERLRALRTGDAVVGDPYWDVGFSKAAVVLTVPIREADGRLLGALAAKINLDSVSEILRRLARARPIDLYVATEQGRIVLGSRQSSQELMRTRLPDEVVQRLLDGPGGLVSHRGADGRDVVAAPRRVPRLRWAAVAQVPRADAYREVARLRTATALTIAGLLAVVALITFPVGLLVVRPLEQLSRAAAKLAAGDLSAELPAGGSGEVGYVARAFGHLVNRLRERESQGELERLSVTDPLTGLYNRRHLMGTLANEVQRSRRLRRTFSVLLADVDHFKRYNDTHGHLAGDAALVKIAGVLRKMTRGVDSVARYGGEEFLVMLIEAPLGTAALVAERIRARVAEEAFDGGPITVSVGVAEYPAHGETPEELIASADAAMYRAKGQGRDRVVAAGALPVPEEPAPRRRARDP